MNKLENESPKTFNEMQFSYYYHSVYCYYNEQERLYTPVAVLSKLSKEEKKVLFHQHKEDNIIIFHGQDWVMSHRLL